MKSWKVLLGVGGACAACCVLPVGAVTALIAGATGGTAMSSGAVLPAVGVAVAVSLVGVGVWWWRRQVAKGSSCGCGPGRCG